MSPLRLAISLGDPGGIGPEIAAAALQDDVFTSGRATAVMVGHPQAWQQALALRGTGAPYDFVRVGADRDVATGRVSAENGHIAHESVVTALDLVRNGAADALVTAPLSKEALFSAGYEVPGHTELLAVRCGLDPEHDVRMMLDGGGLRVILHTIHVPLSAVPGLVSQHQVFRTLEIAAAWCGVHKPAARIAVCGLNPHAGENGHFGREDIDAIAPAILAAAERYPHLAWSGPHPADTIFYRARTGDFDVVVAMYHDQALIPVKTLDFHGGVNITVGLPIVRTSPDHGTAFELSGRRVAHAGSMIAACRKALDLVEARRQASV